jgi:hypothetical protein
VREYGDRVEEEHDGTRSIDGMKNKPSAQDHQRMSPTPTPSTSRSESRHRMEKCPVRLACEWGSLV